ncbi:hypothetical protein FN846DRAFT_1002737 [Sphaerosporella brunnea]|uniref:Uncharacterized protein n=1 Tax=Sphaerosporella brunnea TaxID=1250544 RepID=A0A5J5EER5_9PEZI|nr:hypothetical protein FN846DRAFT_1002737 [Sphaerosporella brunnea]
MKIQDISLAFCEPAGQITLPELVPRNGAIFLSTTACATPQVILRFQAPFLLSANSWLDLDSRKLGYERGSDRLRQCLWKQRGISLYIRDHRYSPLSWGVCGLSIGDPRDRVSTPSCGGFEDRAKISSPSPGVTPISQSWYRFAYGLTLVHRFRHPLRPTLQEIAANSKDFFERRVPARKHWAAQILASSNGDSLPHVIFSVEAATTPRPATPPSHAFPTSRNYMELATALTCSHPSVHPHRIDLRRLHRLPAPIAADKPMLLGALSPRRSGKQTNIDNSARRDRGVVAALRQARQDRRRARSMAAGLLTFQLADAAAVQDIGSFEVVLLSGLVGDTEAEKRRSWRTWRGGAAAGRLLVLRSAHGLRKLLYQENR